MSNYTKSFNFRNGVQVDDDRFVVNAAGLVGIGTTRPKTLLDVQGPANISGIASLSGSVIAGVVTAGVIKIDAVSGIITATKFVGDATGLQNIVAIATDGWIANTGSLSTTAKIGIGTLSPNSQLDVLGNTNIVGFTTLLGITTSIGTLFVDQLSASGISSLVGHAKLNTVQVTGLATFTSVIDANGGAGISSIRIGVTGSNEIDTEVGNLTLDSASGQTTIDDNLIVSGILTANDYSGPAGTAATFTNGIKSNDDSTFTDINAIGIGATNLSITGITTAKEITSGGDSVTLTLKGNPVEIKSSKSASETMFRGTDNGSVELFNDNIKKFETISVGASVYGQLNIASLNGGASALSTHFGSIRYGNTDDSFGYSTRRSLDLINTDTGNVNFYVNINNITGPAGDFRWFKGNAPKMTLVANTGNLGIGKTNPSEKLHVVGIITTTSDLFVASDVSVAGIITMTGATSSINGNLNGNVSGNVTGLVNSTSGVSTFSNLKITSGTTTQIARFGVNKTPDTSVMVDIIGPSLSNTSKVFITNDGNIGINTTRIDDTVNINALQSKATLGAVGVGTTNPLAAVDFSAAGQDATGAAANRMYAYMPTVTNAQEGNLVGMRKGALVFNSDSEKLKFYNGTSWQNV